MAEKCLSAMQALALMAAFKDEWPCLIIVPSSLRGIFCSVCTSSYTTVLCLLMLNLASLYRLFEV